jgi:hypothetical protein
LHTSVPQLQVTFYQSRKVHSFHQSSVPVARSNLVSEFNPFAFFLFWNRTCISIFYCMICKYAYILLLFNDAYSSPNIVPLSQFSIQSYDDAISVITKISNFWANKNTETLINCENIYSYNGNIILDYDSLRKLNASWSCILHTLSSNYVYIKIIITKQ